MGDRGRVEELVLWAGVPWRDRTGFVSVCGSLQAGQGADQLRTGTFFWVMTTETPAPRMASEVWPDEVMALKAYSADNGGRGRANSSSARCLAQQAGSRGFCSPIWYSRPSGLKTVKVRSNEDRDTARRRERSGHHGSQYTGT